MARPVRPGTGTTHRTSEASQPGKQNGTLFADPIRASSPKSTASTGRTEDCSRPTPIRQISLAMREPSTEDVRSSVVVAVEMSAAGGFPTFAPPDDTVAPIAAVRWTSGTDRAADPSAGRPEVPITV